MRNRQIQEERIKTYFLDAAKNLLRAEGLKGVSVRNVAYRAGYSYATLYNYFKDINDLLFRCVEDFCQEVGDFVAARTEGGAPGREGLRRTARAYVEYFVEYPGVFELFFLERLGGFGDRTETAALITGLLGRLCEPRLAECIADGTYTAGEAAAVEEGLRCMLPGMLLLYENRLAPDNYEEFHAVGRCAARQGNRLRHAAAVGQGAPWRQGAPCVCSSLSAGVLYGWRLRKFSVLLRGL